MLYSVVRQTQAAARSPAPGLGVSAAGAAGVTRGARPGPPGRALGRRPGRDHDLLDRRRPLRLHVALTQVLNAVLLLPLLVALRALGRNERLLGAFANGRGGDLLALGAFGVVAVSLVGLAVAALAR